jgi:hypothetical protein
MVCAFMGMNFLGFPAAKKHCTAATFQNIPKESGILRPRRSVQGNCGEESESLSLLFVPPKKRTNEESIREGGRERGGGVLFFGFKKNRPSSFEQTGLNQE